MKRLLVMMLPLLAGAGYAPSPRYSPPELPQMSANQLQILRDELAQGNFDEAAQRLQPLLRQAPPMMLADETGGTVSIQSWLLTRPGDTRAAIAKAHKTLIGDEAGKLARVASERKPLDLAAIASIARRFPLTRAAMDTLARAASRSRDSGDDQDALDLLEAAQAHGYQLRDTDRDWMQKQSTARFLGDVPFTAPWQLRADALSSIRCFPYANDKTIYLCGPASVAAVGEDGARQWMTDLDDRDADVSGIGSDLCCGPTYAVAAVQDRSNIARMLIVRQCSGASKFYVRALRASDGRELWTTRDRRELADLNMLSNPSVAGRYVYALAGETEPQSARLWLLAIDVMDGGILWRCDLGSVARRQTLIRRGPGEALSESFDGWMNSSAPAVIGDQIIVTANIGCAIAVGRFDGVIRWLRPYQLTEDEQSADSSILRWHSTAMRSGSSIVVAPQDCARIIAMDPSNGKLLWESGGHASDSLVSADASSIIVAGRAVSCLDTRSGEARWTWQGGATGPVIANGASIFVPTRGGTIALSIADGSTTDLPAVHPPDFRQVVASKSLLNELRVFDAFTEHP